MKKFSGAFQIASVYVGTVIGAGFATGKEIVEFFTQYSWSGFLSIFLSGALFILLGTKIMEFAIEIQANSFEELNEHLFGSFFSKIMNAFMTVMLIGVCSVMLSGAEALFTEQLSFPRELGTVFTVILTLVIMAIGIKGLFAVNSFVVPLLIIFNGILLYLTVNKGSFLIHFLDMPGENSYLKAFGSAFSYAAFNLSLAQAVLVPIATEINDRQMIRLGGLIGGSLLSIILLASQLTLITLPNLLDYEIPMAVIVQQAMAGIYILYLLIIYGEIFTSLIGNLYGIEKQLRNYLNIKKAWIYFGVLVIVYFIAKVDYGKLLGFLYPSFGYISLVFLILLWFKPLSRKK